MTDIFASLAKESVESFVKTGKVLGTPQSLPNSLNRRAGAFVSIHTKDGSLRGCIGTFLPTRENLALEIIHNAIAAATQDPRFSPVEKEELGGLEFSVDILSEPEKIDSPNKLNPKKYGVIVEKGLRKGLLLPDLEGVETVEQQLEICCRKAGIYPDENPTLYRFTVERHGERDS